MKNYHIITLLTAISISCNGYRLQTKNQSDFPIYFEASRPLCNARWDTPMQPGDFERTDNGCTDIDLFNSISITKQHTGPTVTIKLPSGGLTGDSVTKAKASNTDKELILELTQYKSSIVKSYNEAEPVTTSARAPLPAQLTQIINKTDQNIFMSPVINPNTGKKIMDNVTHGLGETITIGPKQTRDLPAVIPPEFEGGYIQFWFIAPTGPRYTIQAMGANNAVHLRGPDANGQWTDWVYPGSLTDYVLVIQENGIPMLAGPDGNNRATHLGH